MTPDQVRAIERLRDDVERAKAAVVQSEERLAAAIIEAGGCRHGVLPLDARARAHVARCRA